MAESVADNTRSADEQASFSIGGETLPLPQFQPSDWLELQRRLTKSKRVEILRLVAETYDELDESIAERLRSDAFDYASTMAEASPQELYLWLRTASGAANMVHVALEKLRPGKWRLADVAGEISKLDDAAFNRLFAAHLENVLPQVEPAQPESAQSEPVAG